MSDIIYDDSQLQQMFADLSLKERVKALKSACRRGGNKVKQRAIAAMTFRHDSSLTRGIRVLIFKNSVGFRVTIGSPKGQKKAARTTTTTDIATGKKTSKSSAKDRSYILRFFEASSESERHWRTGSKKSTGVLGRVPFMESAKETAQGEVNEQIQEEYRQNIIRISEKHGCKTN